jgi:hypothetical protein
VSSIYPRGGWKKCLISEICWNNGFLPTSVGQFTAHSAGWLILFLACCTNRSGPSVHAANSSKPPPTPLFRFSQLFHNTAGQNFGRSKKKVWQTLVSTFSHRIIVCWIRHVPWICAKTNCLLSSNIVWVKKKNKHAVESQIIYTSFMCKTWVSLLFKLIRINRGYLRVVNCRENRRIMYVSL